MTPMNHLITLATTITTKNNKNARINITNYYLQSNTNKDRVIQLLTLCMRYQFFMKLNDINEAQKHELDEKKKVKQ